MDCSGDEPVVIPYPDLPVVAGNGIECSCVLEARNNESKHVEAVVSCMDQSLYHIAMEAITEVSPSVVKNRILSHPDADRRADHIPDSIMEWRLHRVLQQRGLVRRVRPGLPRESDE